MEVNKQRIHFHDTFPPQLGYVAKILGLASQDYTGDKHEISAITGIPTGQSRGKVVPHIKYAKHMNLINYEVTKGKYKIWLTDMGTEVFYNDKFMLEEITKTLCNYWITDEKIGAPQWAYLFRIFPHSFDRPVSISFIKGKSQDFFNEEVEYNVVKSCFTNGGCFESLDLMDWQVDTLLFKTKRSKYDERYVYAYTLLKSWDMYYTGIQEITINQLIDELAWNIPFGFDHDETLDALDEIADIGLVSINKQLTPVTIIKANSAESVLDKLYSLLM